jgi:putative oxidoreductase
MNDNNQGIETMNNGGVVLLGRILLGVLFVWGGIGKVMGFGGTVQYIGSSGLPLPQLLAIGAIVVELGGGLLLIAGWKARWAALALAGFTLVAGLVFHAFWAAPPDQVMSQQVNFVKNIAIIGGLLMVCAHGPGRLSVDKG